MKGHPYTREELLDAFEGLLFRVKIPDTHVAGHGEEPTERRTVLLPALEAWKTSRRHIETGWYVPLTCAIGGQDRECLGHVHLLTWWVEPQSEGPTYVAVLLKYIGCPNRFATLKAKLAAGHRADGEKRTLPYMASIEVLEKDVLSVALIPDIFHLGPPLPMKRPRAKNRKH